MKPAKILVALVAILPVVASPTLAGPIQKACMASDRGGNRSLCSCIQEAADLTLSNSDQRKAAKFFKDPEEAHATWVSQSSSDDAFWERYKSFGQTAEAYCAG